MEHQETKATILIVDDNEENRDVFVQLFTYRGYHVLSADNGAQALAIVAHHRPNLILMDLSMPLMNGWEAIRSIKAAPDMKTIPILALTAHAMERERLRAFEAGCDDYMVKPVDLLALLAQAEKLLQLYTSQAI